jgi:perosamine synthetase
MSVPLPPIPGPSPSALLAAMRLLANATPGVHGLSTVAGNDTVSALEAAFAKSEGGEHALALNSGTAALYAALLAAGVGPGDEVVVCAYGWAQTVTAVLATGALPVFADVGPGCVTVDPRSVRGHVGPRTAAIVATHLMGFPADASALERIAEAAGVFLLFDAAQATGATVGGAGLASFGDATAYSLGPGKMVSAGEGGVLVTPHRWVYERAMVATQHPLRVFGEVETEELRQPSVAAGFSLRLHPVAAAIGLADLQELPARVEAARTAASAALRLLERVDGLHLVAAAPDSQPSWYALPLLPPGDARRDRRCPIVERAVSAGIPLSAGPVRAPLHLRHPFAEGVDAWSPRALRPTRRHPTWIRGSCPVAERRCAREELVLHRPDRLGRLLHEASPASSSWAS